MLTESSSPSCTWCLAVHHRIVQRIKYSSRRTLNTARSISISGVEHRWFLSYPRHTRAAAHCRAKRVFFSCSSNWATLKSAWMLIIIFQVGLLKIFFTLEFHPRQCFTQSPPPHRRRRTSVCAAISFSLSFLCLLTIKETNKTSMSESILLLAMEKANDCRENN